MSDGEERSDASLVLGLSLFIMLLAFFIVLNGLSEFSEPKVGAAFESLDTAFAKNILVTEFSENSADERESDAGGAGDSVEELQGILRSILPNLNLNVSPDSGGGNQMVIRMKKGQFAKLSKSMMPVFVRILTQKDQTQSYGVTFTSYVRDPMAREAVTSFKFIDRYVGKMVAAGLPRYRASLSVEKGNPSMMSIGFFPMREGAQ